MATAGSDRCYADFGRATFTNAIENELELIVGCFAYLRAHVSLLVVEDVIGSKLAQKIEVVW